MKPDVEMPGARLYCGDAVDVLAALPEASVQCVVTSPPYWGLRSYLPADHPDQGREIGQEASIEEHMARLSGRTVLCYRPTCEHDDDTGRCIVLDPFSGTASCGVVVRREGCDYIGIDLSPEYTQMARERLEDPMASTLRRRKRTRTKDGKLRQDTFNLRKRK